MMDKEIAKEFKKIYEKLDELEKKSKFYKHWTKKEDKILMKYYKTMQYKGISKMVGRTRNAIANRIAYLKDFKEEEKLR